MRSSAQGAPRVLAAGPGRIAWIHLAACSIGARSSKLLLRGRGMQRATSLLSKIFGKDGFALFQVFNSRVLKVPLSDYYWLTPLLTGGAYEPEISFILAKVMKSDSAFVDCGANIGWWSLYASTVLRRRDQILAIEASPSMFIRLTETARLNDDRFLCLNAAVWEDTGLPISVTFDERFHSAASVKEPSRPGSRREKVTSIRIDDATERYLHPSGGTLILKLDVEGAEVKALRGAERLLDERTLVIYEDHGKDSESTVTKAMIRSGFRIFYCDEQLRVHQINSIERALSFKRNRHKGYNFFACRPSTALHRQLSDLHMQQATPT